MSAGYAVVQKRSEIEEAVARIQAVRPQWTRNRAVNALIAAAAARLDLDAVLEAGEGMGPGRPRKDVPEPTKPKAVVVPVKAASPAPKPQPKPQHPQYVPGNVIANPFAGRVKR